MDTIVVNHKMYEIQKSSKCDNCMFYDKNRKPRFTSRCTHEAANNFDCVFGEFIYIRRIKFFERIKLWFKKKIKK